MTTRQQRNVQEVFLRLDGRTHVYLSKLLENIGVRVTPAALWNYDNGRRTPDMQTLEAINEVLSAKSSAKRVAAIIRQSRSGEKSESAPFQPQVP